MKWVPRNPGTALGILLDYSGYVASGLYVHADERRPKRILLVLSTCSCDCIEPGDTVTFDDGMAEQLVDDEGYTWTVIHQNHALTVTKGNHVGPESE